MHRLGRISMLGICSLAAACALPLYDGDGENAPTIGGEANVPADGGGKANPDDTLASYDSQATYTYPGCPDEDWGCKRAVTYRCAKRTITARYAECRDAAECVAVNLVGDCIDDGLPALVNSAQVAAFEDEIDVEIARYCEEADCMSSGQPPGGAYPECTNGLCTWTWLPDAGT